MMTRKHFEIIARVLHSVKPNFHDAQTQGESSMWDSIVREFCNVLQTINPRFDADKFIAACGIKDDDL